MLLGVVSDTHGHLPATQQAVRELARHRVQEVIHCGDIGGPELVGLFSAWPTHFVSGNVDRDEAPLRAAAAAAGLDYCGRQGTLEREGVRIAFLHGDDAWQLQAAIQSGQWDLVCADTRTWRTSGG